jgi:L-rhamnose mutarotase
MTTSRFGQVIGIDPDQAAEYERLHADVWPGVLATIHACNIRNYSIFRHGDRLFAYYEYVGDDHEADMARMDADPVTREWWAVVGPMQRALPDRDDGEWWHTIQEVFHVD